MAANDTVKDLQEVHFFTCLSCCIAFNTADDQKAHYRSDHHRYNMKRRVASLPPISAAVFNQKVLEKRSEAVVTPTHRLYSCDVCSKVYTTENAFRSHFNSKKHKDSERKPPTARRVSPPSETASTSQSIRASHSPDAKSLHTELATLTIDQSASESSDAVDKAIDAKINASSLRLSPAHCLFCTDVSPSLEANLTHMSTAHSFFIPDAEYLVDITGLVTYLGEKIAIGNVCIYCNTKSREFRTIEAARKHMIDKGHCKIAYDTENDRLELSDYYDFSSSYPDAHYRQKAKTNSDSADEDWEDVEQDGQPVDEIKNVVEGKDEDDSEDSDDLPESQITYGDSNFELVLPSGARIGHRSMRRYYAQRFTPTPPAGGKPEDPNSGAALVRRLLADKNSALIPRRGGFGAFGTGTEVIRVRNRGEAREAGRHIREYRDQRRREEFKTKIGMINNAQKHFRDQLLQ